MGRTNATKRLTSFFEIVSVIEVVIVRLIIFALFAYGACQLALKLYNLDKPHATSLRVPQIRLDSQSQQADPHRPSLNANTDLDFV
jgi:hypothetical protein